MAPLHVATLTVQRELSKYELILELGPYKSVLNKEATIKLLRISLQYIIRHYTHIPFLSLLMV